MWPLQPSFHGDEPQATGTATLLTGHNPSCVSRFPASQQAGLSAWSISVVTPLTLSFFPAGSLQPPGWEAIHRGRKQRSVQMLDPVPHSWVPLSERLTRSGLLLLL